MGDGDLSELMRMNEEILRGRECILYVKQENLVTKALSIHTKWFPCLKYHTRTCPNFTVIVVVQNIVDETNAAK